MDCLESWKGSVSWSLSSWQLPTFVFKSDLFIIHAKNVEESMILGTNDCYIASSHIIVSLSVRYLAKLYYIPKKNHISF